MDSVPILSVVHFSHDRFHDQFRQDLLAAQSYVVLLSPFLSKNRASSYCPVFQSLTDRSVRVQVFAKPKQEHPESLQGHFDDVKRRLEASGVEFVTRLAMHEKVAAIDEKILWHGSLNILSHNNTRESMLRFESTQLVQEVLENLLADVIPHEPAPGHQELPANSPTCPVCEGTMQPYNEIDLWLCSRSPDCSGTLPMQVGQISFSHDDVRLVELACPLCGDPLEVRRGIFTQIRCTSAVCHFAFEPRISAGILRLLR